MCRQEMRDFSVEMKWRLDVPTRDEYVNRIWVGRQEMGVSTEYGCADRRWIS